MMERETRISPSAFDTKRTQGGFRNPTKKVLRFQTLKAAIKLLVVTTSTKRVGAIFRAAPDNSLIKWSQRIATA